MTEKSDAEAYAILARVAGIASPQERMAYLDEACADDQELRQRVERLLSVYQQAGSFLDSPVIPAPLGNVAQSQDNTIDAPIGAGKTIGAQIGAYKILEEIGEGGFGVVYMAEQQRPVRRKVALKIIKPGMDSREVIARFEAEQQALALMDHVNIARVLDAGATDDGRPYFAMELVKGVPITEYCDKNKLSLSARLELFVTVCRAVQHAHQKGVIHRDIKPSNIMVTLHDGKPVPKVIDFGVAKAITQSLTEKTLFTHYGQMIGTPQYMSPEQAEMSGLEVDTRSDIYSLGVLLYEMLTATTPVTAEQLRATGFGEIQRVIREEEPPTPSTRLSTLGDRLTIIASHRQCDASKLRQLLRGELDWIVMKSLDKDRTRRYDTASAFAGDVEAYLHDEPVLARPPSVGYLLGKAIRKHRVLVTTIAAIAIILVGATVISGFLAVRATTERRRADLHAGIAIVKAAEARTLAEQTVEQNTLLSVAEKRLTEQLYAANMNAVSQAYDEANIDRVIELLDFHHPQGTEIDQRGIEWFLWWRAVRLQQTTHTHLRGGAFMRQDVDPKGDIVAVVGTPNELYLYSSFERGLVRPPIKIGSHYDWPCFSTNGDYLVVAGVRDGVIRVFDTKNWQLVEELQSPGVHSIAMSKGPTPLMATGGSSQITLWSQAESSWSIVGKLPAEGDVKRLAFTRNGTHLFATFDDSRMAIYEAPRGKVVANPQSEGIVQVIAASPRGDLFAVGHNDGSILVWELDAVLADDTSQPVKRLTADASVAVLTFSPSGRRLAAGTNKRNTVVVWDIIPKDRDVSNSGQPIATIPAHSQVVMGVGFVKENTFWSSSVDGSVKTWDLSEGRLFDTIPGVHAASPLGFNPKNVLIYLDAAGTIQRWNVTDREYLDPIDEDVRYGHAKLSDDGSVLAGVTHENELRVWLTERRELLYTMPLKLQTVLGLAVNRDGKRVVCVVRDGGVQRILVIDMERGEVMGPLDFEAYFSDYLNGHVSAAPCFSPDARYCTIQLALDAVYTTVLFDITKRPFERKYKPLPGWGPQLSAAFTPDGKTLAIGSSNNTIRLHDAENGSLNQILKGHSGLAKSLVFSGNGTRLIASVADRVYIWRISDGSLLTSLRSGAELRSVAVAPHEESLAALTVDGTINIWRSASKDEADK